MHLIFLSLLLSPSIIIVHVIIILIIQKNKYVVKFMFISFIIYFLFCLFLCMFFLDYKFFTYKDYLASICVITFFSLGYMMFFSLICRGFSLRMMTDIYIHQSMSKQNILNQYADGKGIDWMFRKRLNNIQKLRLIKFEEKKLSLIYPQGYVCSLLSIMFKKMLNLKKGGE